MARARATSKGARAPSRVDEELGERLRLTRKRRGISLSAFAEKMGVTSQQVQRYERGANRISATRLVAFSRALDVPLSVLLEPNDTPPSQPKVSPLTQEAADLFSQVEDSRLRVKLLALIRVLADCD